MNFKAYFIFLRRHAGYTLINVFGFAMSMIFVLVIGAYVYRGYHFGHEQSKAERITSIGFRIKGYKEAYDGFHHYLMRQIEKNFPEVEMSCGICASKKLFKTENGKVMADMITTDSTFFRMLDFKLVQGDAQTCLNNRYGVVVTQSFARKVFGTEQVVGKKLIMDDNVSLRITGVMADVKNTLLSPFEVVAPFYLERWNNVANCDDTFKNGFNLTGCQALLLTRTAGALAGKEKELTRLCHALSPVLNSEDMYCDVILTPYTDLYFSDVPSAEGITRRGDVTMVHLLGVVGLVVLLFSMMNYVNLTVAQSGFRSKEMATRRLFGSSKKALMTKLIIESVMLTSVSLLLAYAVAVAVLPYTAKLFVDRLTVSDLFQPWMLTGSIFFILLVGVLSGVVPAFVMAKAKPIDVVRGTFRYSTKMVLSKVFIVVQHVVTVAMLATALTMSSQMAHLLHAPLGYNTKHLMAVDFMGIDDKSRTAFIEEVKRLPYVKKMSASLGTPVENVNNNTMPINGKMVRFQVLVGDSAFLNIYGIKVKRQVEQSASNMYYLNEAAMDAVGMARNADRVPPALDSLNFYRVGKEARFAGVLQPMHLYSIASDVEPLVYGVHETISDPWNITLLIEGDEDAACREVARLYQRFFNTSIDENSLMVEQRIADKFADELRMSRLVTLFTGVVLLISLLGLVAMSTYFIRQRRKEIALRKVFGSTRRQILVSLLHTFGVYTLVACVIALPVAWYLCSDWMAQFNYRATWWYWLPLAALADYGVSVVAVYLQSRAAANENPVKNLKQE